MPVGLTKKPVPINWSRPSSDSILTIASLLFSKIACTSLATADNVSLDWARVQSAKPAIKTMEEKSAQRALPLTRRLPVVPPIIAMRNGLSLVEGKPAFQMVWRPSEQKHQV